MPSGKRQPAENLHPACRKLFEISHEQPGLNIDELAERLKLSRGATRYHLRGLLKEGKISTLRQGHHLLHFPGTTPPLQRKAVALLRVRSVRLTVERLIKDPQSKPADLARELGISPRSIRRSLHQLVRSGLATREPGRNGKGPLQTVLGREVRLAWVLWCKEAGHATTEATPQASPAWLAPVETFLLVILSSLFG